MKALNHLDKHFILYAKNHYKRIDDPLTDLGNIVNVACALPEGHTQEYRAYELVSETFVKVATSWMIQDFFKRLFMKVGTLKVSEANYQYATDLMLGHLQVVRINGEGKFNIGEADPKVWPLKEN